MIFAMAEPPRTHKVGCCLDLDHQGDCKRWMKLPPNPSYPDFAELHQENDWCPKGGCRPACQSEIDAIHVAVNPAGHPEGGEPRCDRDVHSHAQCVRPQYHEGACMAGPVEGISAEQFYTSAHGGLLPYQVDWTPVGAIRFAEAYAAIKVREAIKQFTQGGWEKLKAEVGELREERDGLKHELGLALRELAERGVR